MTTWKLCFSSHRIQYTLYSIQYTMYTVYLYTIQYTVYYSKEANTVLVRSQHSLQFSSENNPTSNAEGKR